MLSSSLNLFDHLLGREKRLPRIVLEKGTLVTPRLICGYKDEDELTLPCTDYREICVAMAIGKYLCEEAGIHTTTSHHCALPLIDHSVTVKVQNSYEGIPKVNRRRNPSVKYDRAEGLAKLSEFEFFANNPEHDHSRKKKLAPLIDKLKKIVSETETHMIEEYDVHKTGSIYIVFMILRHT